MAINAIRDQLRQAPLDFLSAVSSSTLPIFEKAWCSLRQDVDRAWLSSSLNDEDERLIHATATLIATWSELLCETDIETAVTTASFVDEIEDTFARLTIGRTVQHTSPHLPDRRHSRVTSTPTYILAAYAWISHNIHNPYPSSDIKERISRDAGRPLRVITDWFKEVRRHIGWVSMCKDHFEGSRARAVQAAKDAYLRTESASLSPELISQFEDIHTRLRDMYRMVDDNGDLSDSTDDSFTPSSSFPGPAPDQSSFARSRSSSSTPSLVFSSDDEDNQPLASFAFDDAPANLGKRKNFYQEDEARPLKRTRSGFISVADRVGTNIVTMSPVASAEASPRAASDLIPSLLQTVSSRKRRLSVAATEWEDTVSTPSECDTHPPLRLPKRRLSVSDSQPTPKRPCLPPAVGPRKQAVSTPVPIAHQTMPTVDNWFPFELPDTSLSVELFNWDVVVENDAFLYNSLFDDILQSDAQVSSNVTPLSDAYQSPVPLDLGTSAVDPSVLDISSAFIELLPTQLTAPTSTLSREPTTATTTPVFDFDAFVSVVNAEPQSTQSFSSPSMELSLNDSIGLFGDL